MLYADSMPVARLLAGGITERGGASASIRAGNKKPMRISPHRLFSTYARLD